MKFRSIITLATMVALGLSVASLPGKGCAESEEKWPNPLLLDPIAVEETCPALAYVLVPGDSLTQSATTAGKTDDYGTQPVWHCGDERPDHAPDVAFTISIPFDGVIKLDVTSTSSLNPVVYQRDDCEVENLCLDFSATTEKFHQNVTAGVHSFIIDGKNETSGSFNFTLSYNLATCGDGVVSGTEACDLGVSPPSTLGCSTSCQFLPPPTGTDTCPGQAVSVSPGTTQLVGANGIGNTTLGYSNESASTCTYAPGGPEKVYDLVPQMSGTLTVTVGRDANGITVTCDQDITNPFCWDYVLYARSTCNNPLTELDCSDIGVSPETISFPVTAGMHYFVFVDGFDDQYYSRGPFNLLMQLM